MAKGVLGNDPFRRSAAPRPEAPAPQPAPPATAAAPDPRAAESRAAQPRKKKSPAKAPARPAAASATTTRTKGAPKAAPTRAQAEAPRTPERSALEPEASTEALETPTFAPRKPTSRLPLQEAPPTAEPSESEAALSREVFADPAPEPETPATGAQVPLASRAMGALALARDILVQALDRPGLKRVSEIGEALMLAFRTGLGIAGGGMALDPYGKDPSLATRLEPLVDFLYERYWRVTVENAAALPAGPAILVANHAGALPLDGPVLALAVSRERPDLQEARWLVEDQVFYAPFWGTLLNRLGAIRASPENALRLLDERRPVLVFPEGVQGTGKGYRERYRLKRFGRGGFVKLALRTGAPIVPVAIVGSEESTPVLAKLPGKALGLPFLPITTPVPLPVHWAIRFGAPIRLTRPDGDELAFVQQTTERTRSEIEAMLHSLLRERSR